MSLGPVVLHGVLRYLSVSQLDKFDERVDGGCERRWWFRYVARKPEPERAPAKLGTQIHAQIEHYLKTGQDTLGPLARAGSRFIPRPGSDLLVEYPFGRLWEHAPAGYHGPVVSLLSAGGVPFVGKVDLLHTRGFWLDDEGVERLEPGVPEIVDWKALDITTPILTKSGWKTMGALVVGDFVYAPDGQLTRVSYVSPVGKRPAYQVMFEDHTSLVTDADHLWLITEKTPGGRYRRREIKTSDLVLRRAATDLPLSLQSEDVLLPIDPYVLGAWLGDGTRSGGRVCFDSQNEGPFVHEEIERRGYLASSCSKDKTCCVSYYPRLQRELARNSFFDMSKKQRINGILQPRQIPEIYLNASAKQRADLLRGLLDTDGSCSLRGQVSFSTIHRQLAQQVLFLARSLGFKAGMCESRATLKGVDKGAHFQVFWEGFGPTFGMSRKQKRIVRDQPKIRATRRWVRSVVAVGEREVRCIAVEHPSQCYVAGRDLIVTHNTSKRLVNETNEQGELVAVGWAKSAEAIANGWQGRGYGRLALTIWPEAPAVRIGHGYFRTQGPREALKVSSCVPAETLQTTWAEADGVVSKMKVAANETDVNAVKPNYAACGAYGGCPYVQDCPRDAKAVLAAALKPRR